MKPPKTVKITFQTFANMKLLVLASFAILATSESKKHCDPCVKPNSKPAKRPNPDCIKKKIPVDKFRDSSTDPSIEGNSKTSSSFGNRENQDYVEINVQVNTEYKDQFDTKTETITKIEDCNCDCDCDKNNEEDSNRNAAAKVSNQVETHQYFEATDSSSSGDNQDDDDRSSGLSGVCETFDCPNPPCQIFCEAENGYYPDSRDCRNFCFCSGNIKVPSKFQRCAGGLLWDPSCGEDGCCNWPSDSSSDHCALV